MTKVMLLNVNVSGLVAPGTKEIPLNIIVPPRSELNQPKFALVHPVTLEVVQGANPKLPLKVVTVAEKPSPEMFTLARTDGAELTRVAIPLTLVIVIGSAWADAKGKNPMTRTANNWMSFDVEDIGDGRITITSLPAG
jgi:hypothetical protein